MINAYVGDERDFTSQEAPIVRGGYEGSYTEGSQQRRRYRGCARAARARPARAGAGDRPRY